VDSIDSALKFIEDEKVREGLKLINKIIEDALLKSGVEVIDIKEGDMFSAEKCEAVGYEEIDSDELEFSNGDGGDEGRQSAQIKDGTILKVVRRGFKFADRIIRPAQVVVAKVKKRNNSEN
jgi:molecular chaperone GrpE (heat shock protein)